MADASVMRGVRGFLIGSAVAVLATTPALADDRGRGPKIEEHDNGKDYKYEYKDRHCKYEYKLNYRTGEEKVESKGDCRGVGPRRAVYYSDGPIRDYEYDRDSRSGPHGGTRRLSCNREVIGQVLGGVIGGVAGAQVGDGSGRRAATIAGTIIGVMIGGNIGRRMDRADSACAYQALEYAESGETVYWQNPDSQVEYRITPRQLERRADGRQCRDYTATVAGAGLDERSATGTGCRRSDGSWEIVSR